MQTFFIIGTEHQLFQAEMAVRHFKLATDCVSLIILKMDNDSSFIDRVKLNPLFGQIHVFSNWVFKDILCSSRKAVDFITFCYKVKQEYSHSCLFASHYDSDSTLLFWAIVEPDNFYLLDEGTASFLVSHKRANYNKQHLKLFIKSLLYRKRISLPVNLTYFTKYAIPKLLGDKIVKYHVNILDNPLKELIQGEAIFLGSSIAELKLIAEGKYLSMLYEVYKQLNVNHFYYFPHRKEQAEKLELIRNIGFEVKKINEPFEAWFSKQSSCPSVLSSFSITAVLDNVSTLNRVIPELLIYTFDLNYLTKNRQIFAKVSEHLQQNKRLKFIKL